MRIFFTLKLILVTTLVSNAQTLDFSIHFEKDLAPYFIEIQKGSQKDKIQIDVSGNDITFQLEDTLSYFTLWVEEKSMRIPLFQKDVQASMHLLYPIASMQTNDSLTNNWLSIVRIKNDIQDELKLSSLTADTTQYVDLFEQHWNYYEKVLSQCHVKHGEMESICTAELLWLEAQKANNWKKQKYRMGVNFRRLSFKQKMIDIVGTEALKIHAVTANNDSVYLQDLRGKPIVIDFWATWCGPCTKEKPYWSKMEEKFGDEVHFVSIGVKSQKEKWLSRLPDSGSKNEWFISKRDEDQLEKWNVYFIPRYVLIDEKFKVVNTDLKGPSKRAFELELSKLLD